jgi:hypothetical protein
VELKEKDGQNKYWLITIQSTSEIKITRRSLPLFSDKNIYKNGLFVYNVDTM